VKISESTTVMLLLMMTVLLVTYISIVLWRISYKTQIFMSQRFSYFHFRFLFIFSFLYFQTFFSFYKRKFIKWKSQSQEKLKNDFNSLSLHIIHIYSSLHVNYKNLYNYRYTETDFFYSELKKKVHFHSLMNMNNIKRNNLRWIEKLYTVVSMSITTY